MFDINEDEILAKIKIIGVGGGGINAVNQMIEKKLSGVEFVAVDTYETFLSTSQAPCKIKIDENDIQSSSKEILTALEGNDMVFIVAGMGGGTATGVAPIIAKYSKRLGALTIAVVTRPFTSVNPRRKEIADIGIKNLCDCADSVVVVSSDKILQMEKNISTEKALSIANDVLFDAVKGISYLVTMPGLVNLDLGDVKCILENSGIAVIGIGEAGAITAAINAAKNALNSPLLEKNIQGSRSILLNITAAENSLTMTELMNASIVIQEAANEAAEIMWGMSIDENLGDKVRVVIIATRFDNNFDNSKKNNFKPQNIKSDGADSIKLPDWLLK